MSGLPSWSMIGPFFAIVFGLVGFFVFEVVAIIFGILALVPASGIPTNIGLGVSLLVLAFTGTGGLCLGLFFAGFGYLFGICFGCCFQTCEMLP